MVGSIFVGFRDAVDINIYVSCSIYLMSCLVWGGMDIVPFGSSIINSDLRFYIHILLYFNISNGIQFCT